ncbi:hypothetical protein SEA_RUBEUS_36 [Mycobacterium phage Rubeus]|nr:hypothetical protein SEA_RUBEUS_36 [Mycobacterium phage Rubeus]
MSLKVGGLDVVGVFVGGAAAKVYVGAMKIWPPVPDFTPFTISSEDPGYTDIYDEPVPEGASGAWVTLVGGGGGGGARVRVWVPIEAMGPTYSVTRGIRGNAGASAATGSNRYDGNAGTAGTASTFSSGSVYLTALGGSPGSGGTTTSTSGAGGSGEGRPGQACGLYPVAAAAGAVLRGVRGARVQVHRRR